MKQAISIEISGKVQGVGFRYHCRQIANQLKIYGFVKNKTDGSVYVEALGEDWAIEQFIEWCKQGPSWARVANIRVGTIPLFIADKFMIK